ncbi:MAG TPA: CBS domain-containing protein [Sandaracinaceae bacterium LLY-WYZ-13_1]|nr:CBS domain-containing protein [Sandaracinaceae bacterium LLY-WYZ-13_1]
MAKYVHEVASTELFFLRPSDTVGNAILGILSLGVSSAPIVDGERRPVGVVSLHDLVGQVGGATVGERMTSPALTVDENATIEAAGKELVERDVHRVVVTDADGRAVGVVSSLDLVRALLGLPAHHPDAFPHQDAAGLSWSELHELDVEHSEAAPDGPGLFVLVYDEKGRPSVPVWAEQSPNVRTRLHQIIAGPQDDQPWLQRILEHDGAALRFRAASVPDPYARAKALERAQAEVASASGLPASR